ncbi:hypothetical protein ACFFHK_03765 [Gallibacterium trehalosifermentans]|uniref:Lipoprotein n=1 Tax=Gallibacterium trehalosifermentans TaxID=516935 RepID=A0ABV6GZN7_9PAST
MQQLKNFFLVSLFTLFLAACGDKTVELKTDIDAINQVIKTSLQSEHFVQLAQQLEAAKTGEDKVKVYDTIIDNTQTAIKAFNDLNMKSAETKLIQTKYNDSLKLLVDLMKMSADLVNHQPSQEEIQTYTSLQEKTLQSLADAEKALEDLQKQVNDTEQKK